MSFGITDQGFNPKLESDISDEIAEDLAPTFGVDISTTDWPKTDSPLSQLIKPFSRQLRILWEQMESAFQGMDPAQASGTLMDGILSYSNIERLEATSTEVLAAISGTEGTSVPALTRVSVASSAALFQALAVAIITKATLLRFNIVVSNASNIGVQYTVTLNGHAIASGALGGSPTVHTIAYQLAAAINASVLVNDAVEAVFYGPATIQISTVSNLTVYSVTLNGIAYSFTSDASATNQEIVDGLVAAINLGQSDIVALGVTASTLSLTHRTAGADWALLLSAGLTLVSTSPAGAFAVKSADLKTTFSGDVDTRMAILKLFSPQTYDAIATGPVEAPSGTLINIETQVTGFTAVTNFLDGVLGRDVESDDEARIRRQETFATGAAQVRAVLSALNKLPGVTLSRAYENITDTPDAQGRPGHSVEFLVQGGVDAQIAQVIWDGRSAGITPYGNINADGSVDPDGSGTGIVAQDSNGEDETVHFSRPESVYAFIIAVKTLYSEEDFPDEGDEAIRQALLDFGNAQGIGKDFLIQRFQAQAVGIPGVGGAALQIATSDDPDDPSPTYGTANIAISPRQVLVFDTSRITVS